MTQFGRPNGDISVGLWAPYPASPTTLFDKINEVTPNGDTDYIGSSNDEDECEVSVGAVVDPGVGIDHKIRCYAQCPLGSGAKEQMWIALVENGTERARSLVAEVDRNSYALIEYALLEAEANAIQNYGNLRLRFHITKVNGGEPIQITQADFRCPDATEEHSGSSSISGNGSPVGVAKKGGKQSSLISAAGVLIALGLVGMLGVAPISGGGTLAVIGQKAAQADVAISGGGAVATTGTKAEGEPHSGSASVSGNGVATAQGIKGAEDVGTISSGGEVSSSGTKAGKRTAGATGGGSITVVGTKSEAEQYSGSAVVSGGGTVLSDGEKGAKESSVVSGNGNAIATGKKKTSSPASITGNGALALIGKKETEGTGLISGNGSIITTGTKQDMEPHFGSAVISGGGSINTTGTYALYPYEQRSLGAKRADSSYPKIPHSTTKKSTGRGYKKWL